MQTLKINSTKPFLKITFLAALLLIISCKNGKEPKQGNEASGTTKAKVKPPQTDIHTAVLTDNLEALNQHISAGTDLNEKDPFGGSSPLITASLFGKTAMAKTLIDAGANLNFQNNDGSTPLHTAAFFCRPEIVRMLLDKGADKSLKNKFGATPYESVAIPFDQAKNSYDMMGKILGPMGLKLDYPYIEKTRPEIAAMLK
jgi:ankyrin repeat protein